MTKHQKIHENFHDCNKSFGARRNMKRHMKNVHKARNEMKDFSCFFIKFYKAVWVQMSENTSMMRSQNLHGQPNYGWPRKFFCPTWKVVSGAYSDQWQTVTDTWNPPVKRPVHGEIVWKIVWYECFGECINELYFIYFQRFSVKSLVGVPAAITRTRVDVFPWN